MLVPETPAVSPMEKNPSWFSVAHWGPGLGLEEGILSGCGGYFSETVKENSKRAQLALVWSPPAEAGWAQVERRRERGNVGSGAQTLLLELCWKLNVP